MLLLLVAMRFPYLLLCFIVLLLPLPGFAQPQRYPTDAEIEKLLQVMRQTIPSLMKTGYYTDRRTPKERQQQQAFVEAWAKVDGAIAPFLGNWAAIEENYTIFPSSRRGEVCIIDSHLDQSEFYLGKVVDGKLYTDNKLVLVLDSGFLVSTYLYENRPSHYEYANPRLLENPVNSAYYAEYHPEIPGQFQQAGCLAESPK